MTLRLTPDDLERAYNYLRGARPFKGKRLPDPDDLEFRITRHKDRFGHFDDRDGRTYPNIAISEVHVKTYSEMLVTMAHELVHVALFSAGHKGWDDHGPMFKALAKRVCALHGYDPLTF